jgi:hypothetical protein
MFFNRGFMKVTISEKLSDLTGKGLEFWVFPDSTVRAKFVDGFLCGCLTECQTGSSERTLTV